MVPDIPYIASEEAIWVPRAGQALEQVVYATLFSVTMYKKHLKSLVIVVLILGALVMAYRTYFCFQVPKQPPHMSTHGFDVWSNQLYTSFTHLNKRYCVPSGWEPVGAERLERGGAIFPHNSNGVLVMSEEFTREPLPLEKRDFDLTVIYLKSLPAADINAYKEIIARAYNDVGKLYPSRATTPQTHTVFITVGIAGDGNSFTASIYPKPTQYLSIFAKPLANVRAEELFIHGAMHAYNRFHPDYGYYQSNQFPLTKENFEEMEAAWTEILFRSSVAERERRVDELFTTYEAIMNGEFSDTLLFPFSSKEVFDSVAQKSVHVQPESTHGEVEFGHYILAPLTMLAIEGMLYDQQSSTTVSALLFDTHQSGGNFFELVGSHLTEENTTQLTEIMEGRALIAREIIDSGLKSLKRE